LIRKQVDFFTGQERYAVTDIGVSAMDCRKPLESGYVIDLGGERYTIERQAGRGSNAIVYSATYYDNLQRNKKHTVFIKELFPYHPKGAVYRADSCDILCKEDAADFFSLHRKSFIRGNACQLDIQNSFSDISGGNINTYEKNGTLYTILGINNGETLQNSAEKDNSLQTLSGLTACMLGILESLEVFHKNGFLHLDISPDNVLLWPPRGESGHRRAQLIDYNSMWNMNELSLNGTYFSIKENYSAPELRMRESGSVSPATDLFSVCAVFFEYLTGSPLNFSALYSGGIQIGADGKLLCGVCATAAEKAIAIVKKGLKLPPSQRYQDIESLRSDFTELSRRIAGVGITHAALWEAGRARFHEQICGNKQYNYIFSDEELLPGKIRIGCGDELPVTCALRRLPEACPHARLTAGGGMGKTTALLRLWKDGAAAYHADKPVPVYIPLYRYKYGSIPFVKGYLLERLKFDSKTATVEDALHSLDGLLETRVRCGPSVILLLDGLNEVTEDTRPLLAEIDELAKKKGVQIILTSRSEDISLPFDRMEILPLSREEIKRYLIKRNMLYPADGSTQGIIVNPMMLRMYAAVCGAAHKPVDIGSADELMNRYIDSILQAYREQNIGNEAELLRAEYAVRFLLPEIAYRMKKNKRNFLYAREAYRSVSFFYKLLTKKSFRSVYAQYTGKSNLIKQGAHTAEEWFDGIINTLLFKKFALISVDESGSCRLSHDNYSDYYINVYYRYKAKLRAAGIRAALPFAAAGLALSAVLVYASFKTALLPSFGQPTAQEQFAVTNAMTALSGSLSKLGMQLKYDLAVLKAGEEEGYTAFTEALRYYAPISDTLVLSEPYSEETVILYELSEPPFSSDTLLELLNSPNDYRSRSSAMMENLADVLKDDSVYPEKDRLAVLELYRRYIDCYTNAVYIKLQLILQPLSENGQKPVLDALPYIAVFGDKLASSPFTDSRPVLEAGLAAENTLSHDIDTELMSYGMTMEVNSRQ
jgi:hypothetical protein